MLLNFNHLLGNIYHFNQPNDLRKLPEDLVNRLNGLFIRLSDFVNKINCKINRFALVN